MKKLRNARRAVGLEIRKVGSKFRLKSVSFVGKHKQEER
jgi:hypothetical protein